MAKIKGGTKGGLNDSLFRETIGEFIKPDDGGRVVSITEFVEAPWGLGLDLTPVQRFMLKCIYGMPLDSTKAYIEIPDTLNSRKLYEPMTETEFAKWSYEEERCNIDFSDPNNIGRDFYTFVMALGRRAGKSTICSCIVDYEFYRLFKAGNPHELYDVPPGQEIAVIGTAPTDGQAQIVFNMAKTFCQNSPIMKERVAHPTQTYFEVQTDADVKMFGKGREGSMQFITGGSSSNAIRGHNAIIVLLDEMAFFQEGGNRFSIDEVFGALTPSIAKFTNPESGHMDGKVICLSSPYAHFGKFYDLFRDSFSDESVRFGKTLAFRYYTALVNSKNVTEEYLREEKRKDRGKFRREFEAEFDERITAWIDSEVQFRNNIRRPYIDEKGVKGIRYFYGFDFGTSDNGAAIAIVHKEDDLYKLDFGEAFYPKNAPIWDATVCTIYREHSLCGKFRQYDVLPLFDIADYIKLLTNKFPMYLGTLDQYSGHAIYQILTSKGISNIELKSYNESSKSRVFKLIKELYQECLLDLMEHPILIQEMLNMEAELRPQNKISVHKRSSTDDSFQDDLTDAYVRAVWECWRYHNVDAGKGGKTQAPVLVSFGNGRVINISAPANNDVASKLRGATSYRDFQRTKRSLHGIDTKRNAPKKKKTRGF